MDTEGGGDALDEHKIVVRRLALLIAAAAVVFALYTLRLIFLQLVHGDEFAARAVCLRILPEKPPGPLGCI